MKRLITILTVLGLLVYAVPKPANIAEVIAGWIPTEFTPEVAFVLIFLIIIVTALITGYISYQRIKELYK